MDKDGLLISTLIVSICISPYIGYRDSGRRNICLLGVPTKKKKSHPSGHGYPILDTHGSLDAFFVSKLLSCFAFSSLTDFQDGFISFPV